MAASKKSKKKVAKRPAKKASKKKRAKKASNKTTARRRPNGAGKSMPPENGQLPFEGDDTQTDMFYPAGTIAEVLMITDRHLRRLAKEGVVPKSVRGRYPMRGCVQGYITHLQSLRDSTVERSDEATRLSKVRADTYELELEQRRGQLYKREVVDEALFEACSTLAAMLDGSASVIARQMGGGAVLRKKLLDAFREIRTQYAAGLLEFSERLRTDGWHRRTTARPAARKVGKGKSRPAKRKR